MKKYLLLTSVLWLSGCASQNTGSKATLTEARRGFKTVLSAPEIHKDPVEIAPAAIFQTLHYPAPGGQTAAYLSPDPKDGKKHPAIVWITGGDCNSIGDVWTDAPADNDQTAATYRQAGIVMMFPSLRGGNDNPGQKEGFLGEVDDVLAAADFLAKQPYVDAKRLYLGGHSTGGTLAMLVAEASPRFRATFAFGAVDDVAGYGADSGFLPFNVSDRKEVEVRSPGYFLASIASPLWAFEGTEQGNIESLQAMANASTNSQAHFIPVAGATHFSVLAPTNRLIARKILSDTGEKTNISFSEAEVAQPFGAK